MQIPFSKWLDDDEDGMTNAWEEQYGLDPYDPNDAKFDDDRDGLVNLEEFNADTNPLDPDTDDGGINDGDEVLLQETNPLEAGDDFAPVNVFFTGPFRHYRDVFFKPEGFQGCGKHAKRILDDFSRAAVKQVINKACQVNVSCFYCLKAHQGMVD